MRQALIDRGYVSPAAFAMLGERVGGMARTGQRTG